MPHPARPLLLAASLALAAGVALAPAPAAAGARLLVFSRTQGFRHGSIPAALAAVDRLGQERGWTVTATEDPAAFSAASLADFDAVVFLLTTGDVLGPAEEAALEAWVQGGGGFVGVHSASDTEYDWPFYAGLVGAYFRGHPAPQPATLLVTDRVHPATAPLPERWSRLDEWYDFRASPRGRVHVLMSIDEGSYQGGGMGYDHPLAWCHDLAAGRAFYTALGHTDESWSEPLFLAHLAGGVEWAAGLVAGDCGPTVDDRFEVTTLAQGLAEPMDLEVLPDGRVLWLERRGRVWLCDPRSGARTIAGELEVSASLEDGLLGVAVDPAFAATGRIYLYHSPPAGPPRQRLSSFRLDGDRLARTSEEVVLEIPTQRDECCHSAGALEFDAEGNLFVAVGDNTSPFASDGYAPLDERPGREAFDAQRSAGNTDDLRGKVLRITPRPGGGYDVPAGNLFPRDGSAGRPEVYAMGCRNPFRLGVDRPSGRLYFGDVGPDADLDRADRGPHGEDEWNRAERPGNFGWPYFIGRNRPYVDRDFATGASGLPFDPLAPVNDSPSNTGRRELPPAEPAWLAYSASPPAATDPDLGRGPRAAMLGPVYRFDPGLASEVALPAFYDHTLFAFDWVRGWIRAVRLDARGDLLRVEPFLASRPFAAPIALALGPDGAFYVLEWGTLGATSSDGRLLRVAYPRSRDAPVAHGEASPTIGPVPLAGRFSAAGSEDPNGDPLLFEWDFESDGTIDATGAEVEHTYPAAGDQLARLVASDPGGHRGLATVTVAAGNSPPRVSFELPPVDAGIFRWGERVPWRLRVDDDEEGSTADGGVDCAEVTFQPLVGHDDHAHPLVEGRGCRGRYLAEAAHDAADDLYLVLEGRYRDRSGSTLGLAGQASRKLRPHRREAEAFTAQSGVWVGATNDLQGGGAEINFIDHGDWAAYPPHNLLHVEAMTFRVSSDGLGGRIEVRLGAPSGRLLGTAPVPVTGSWSSYTEVTAPVDDSNTYLQVDLARRRLVSRLVLDATSAPGDRPRGFAVFLSDDGRVFRGPVAAGAGEEPRTDVRFPAAGARHVKVILTADEPAAAWSVAEVELYDEAGRRIDPGELGARASSSAPGTTPAAAVDASLASRWSSGVPQATGTQPIFLVFARNPGDAALFNVNWLRFDGQGMAGLELAEPGAPGSSEPLRLVKGPGDTVLATVEKATGATGYVVYDNDLGAWYGTPRRSCVDRFVDLGGAVRLEHRPEGASRWLRVAAADGVGESSAGLDAAGNEVNRSPGWPATGPCP